MKKLLFPKKLADGGEVREGRNENIGDDTRAKYKAQGYASGGLVQRASVKKHGKAC